MADFRWEDFPEEPQTAISPQAQAPAAPKATEFDWNAFPAEPETGLVRDLKDLGLGATQGATLGFADEIGAGLQTMGQVAQGQVTPEQSLVDQYYKNKESINKNFKEAEERSPYLYGGGEIGGSILSGIIASPLGGVAAAKNAGIGAKIAADAVRGLAPGALQAIGSSENKALGKDANLVGLGTEALGGAATGGIIGATAGAALHGLPALKGAWDDKVASAVKKFGEETPTLAQSSAAYELGKQGLSLGKQSVRMGVDKAVEGENKAILKNILDTDQMLGSRVSDSLNKATRDGVNINLRNEIQSGIADFMGEAYVNKLFALNPKANTAYQKMFLQGKDLNPVEMKTFIDGLDGMIDGLKGSNDLSSRVLTNQMMNLRKVASDKLKAFVPEYKNAATAFANWRQQVPATILAGNVPVELTDTMIGAARDFQEPLYKSIQKMTSEMRKPILSGEKAQGLKFTQLQDKLKELEKMNPEAAAKLMSDKLPGKIKSTADMQAMVDAMRGKDKDLPRSNIVSQIWDKTVGGGLVQQANRAGRIAHGTSKLSQKAFNLGRDAVAQVGEAATAIPGLKSIGESLVKSQELQNEAMKNAALFALVQSADGRNLLKSLGMDEIQDVESEK